jgi:hypothetical protein
MIAFLATTATEGDLDPACTAMISGLLGVRERDSVCLNVRLLQLADADVFITVVANNLDIVFVVT